MTRLIPPGDVVALGEFVGEFDARCAVGAAAGVERIDGITDALKLERGGHLR